MMRILSLPSNTTTTSTPRRTTDWVSSWEISRIGFLRVTTSKISSRKSFSCDARVQREGGSATTTARETKSLTASDAEKIRNITEATCPNAARVATVPKRIPIVSGMLNLSSSFLALDSDASSLTLFWANVSLSRAYLRRKQNVQQGVFLNQRSSAFNQLLVRR